MICCMLSGTLNSTHLLASPSDAYCVLQTYYSLWETTVYCHMLSQMTHKFSISVVLWRLMYCRLVYQTAWTMWHPGWQSIGCNSITVRLKCSDVRTHTVNIRSRLYPFVLVALLCNWSLLFGISGFTWMLTSPCALTWLQLSVHVFLLCSRSAAFNIHCRIQPCWPCFVHSSSASLTIVVLCWPETLLQRLQSVLNAAGLVFSARKTEHTSPVLRELHWLRVAECIKFQLSILTYRCLHGSMPSYLAETILQFPVAPCDSISDLPTLQPCWFWQHVVWHWVTAHFQCLQHEPGIPCLLVSGTHLHWSRTQNCSGCFTLPIDSQTLSAHYTAVLHIQTVNCSSLICVTSDIVRQSCNRNVIAPP